MEGQSPAAESQHLYQSTQWSRLIRRNTVAAPAAGETTSSTSPSLTSTPLATSPGLAELPQQQQQQQQLANYGSLFSAGRSSRLQSSPLPPLLSAPHIQAEPGHRPSSSGASTDRNIKTSRGGHGNRDAQHPNIGEQSLIADKGTTVKMPSNKFELSNPPPTDRSLTQQLNGAGPQQSSSVPSTPHQHPRQFSESREPSPTATNGHSPRSAYSESNVVLPSARLPPTSLGRTPCRFETASYHQRRRFLYSLGDERLPTLPPGEVKSRLSRDEEETLDREGRALYAQLLPTEKSEGRRLQLVAKLERLFNEQWPGHDIRVHVFGSSGNLLCTDDSDVDICITTPWKELEDVCMIADLLSKNGMKNVLCIAAAKVPIVKIFDPELRLACDMNVNNSDALENTRMVKTYVEIDPVVRPLAILIKHWTKQRIVNDAGLNFTLSSYTWICMIIHFLQTRDPPILPALHQHPHLISPAKDGLQNHFADNLTVLRGLVGRNESTLGGLLFQFFRFYGHEFDYAKDVISVRNGKRVSKVDKNWQFAPNNALCVEEPFTVTRNLANTLDDSSFRGLHLELRRAFELMSEAKLLQCCEKFEYPKEEERVPISQKVVEPKKPSVILRKPETPKSAPTPTRGGKRGGRGGSRHQGTQNGNRSRTSSGSTFDNNPPYALPNLTNPSASDTWVQQQLHNQLYTTYSVLQAQENTLRFQLYQQSLEQAKAQAYAQSQGRVNGNGHPISQQATVGDRSRTGSFDRGPQTAPMRPDMYFYPLQQPQYPPTMFAYQTSSTNQSGASSPSMTAALPDHRRSAHRSTVGPGLGQSTSSLRSHSQPASRSGASAPGPAMSYRGAHGNGMYQSMRPNGVPTFVADENFETGRDLSRPLATTPPEPREYLGYYVNNPPNPASQHHMRMDLGHHSSIPTWSDASRGGPRRLSTEQLPQSVLDQMTFDRARRLSRSPSPLGDRHFHSGTQNNHFQQAVSSSNLRALERQGPMVVNGTARVSPRPSSWEHFTSKGVPSGDAHAELVDAASQGSGTASDASRDVEQVTYGTSKPQATAWRTPGVVQEVSPLVVDGSTPRCQEALSKPVSTVTNSFAEKLPAAVNGLTFAEQVSRSNGLSSNTRNGLSRQAYNSATSALDVASSQHDITREDQSYLSPVYETRTPSPSVNRKFERPPVRTNGVSSAAIPGSRSATKLTLLEDQAKLSTAMEKLNGHTKSALSDGSSTGSWQKSKSKKKNTQADLKGSASGLSLSERLPARDSERRGG